jgi:hypothetical protein
MNGVIIIIVLPVLGIYIYKFYFSSKARLSRKIKNTPAKPIREVLDGEVIKIVGCVYYAAATIAAPLSGRKCSYYKVLVEEEKGSGITHGWYRFAEDQKVSLLLVKDGNNYALIDEKYLLSSLVEDKKYYSGFLNDASDNLKNFLKQKGKESTSALMGFNRNLRYKEGILEEGERIAVIGKASWKNRNELDLNLPVEKVLVIKAINDKNPVIVTDNPDLIPIW